MDAYVFIDFDNMLARYRTAGLATLSSRLESLVQSRLPDIDRIYIRLYGGWFGPSGITTDGSRLTQDISLSFPRVYKRPDQTIGHVYCEIASSLIDAPQDIFPHTFRNRRGIRFPLKGSVPSNCASPTDCTVSAVVQWSKGDCPHPQCAASSLDVFSYNEQKLVDALLCCDVIGRSFNERGANIFVLSDDDDMIPAVLMAARAGARVCLVRTRTRSQFPYSHLLINYNVGEEGL